MSRTVTTFPADPMTGRALGAPRVRERTQDLEAAPVVGRAPRTVADYPPGGNIADVLAWVDDPGLPDAVRSARAKAATAAEHDRGQPRKTLLAELSERTG